MTVTHRGIATTLVALLGAMSLIGAAVAQPLPWVGPNARGWGSIGPGMMIGPANMGRALYFQMCHPAVAGFTQWRIERVEQIIRPTEQQRARFDELKVASTQAIDLLRSACPTQVPLTPVAQMEAMEKRLDVMLQAVKTMRPALEAFYTTLSDEQKVRFNSAAATVGWLRRGS